MTSSADGVVGEVAMFLVGPSRARTIPCCVYDNGDYDKDGNWATASPTPRRRGRTAKFDRQRKALQDAGIKINASITDLGSTSKGKLSEYLASGKNRRPTPS